MPLYFKHSSYESFVRQLNLYGFSKVRDLDYTETYKHSKFNRDCDYDEICKIKRNKLIPELKVVQVKVRLEDEIQEMKSSLLHLKFEVFKQEKSLKNIIEGFIKFISTLIEGKR